MKLPINRTIAIATLVVMLCSTLFAQRAINPVTINGTLGDKGGYKQIFLDTLNGQNPWIFVTSTIDSAGNFKLVAPISATNIFRLRLEDNNFMMLILTPGEKIVIKTSTSKLGNDAFIQGSSHTQLLYTAMNASQICESKKAALNKQYNDAQSSPKHDSLSAIIIQQFRENDSIQKTSLKALIDKQPASLAWLFFQDKFDMTNDFDTIDKIDAATYKAYPDNVYIAQHHQQVDIERKTAIGSPAPEIELPDRDGKMRKLSSLKGKVVMVDFWASWCGPCRKENPNVLSIYGKYHDKGFEVFSVSLDKEKESCLKDITADKLIWLNHVSDLKYWKSEGAQTYGVTSIPYTVLIDRKGKIVAKKLRGDELENKVKELCK